VLERSPGSATLELLKLGEPPAPDRVEIADRYYNAGGDTLINAIRELPDDCRVALLIGHAPGAPSLVHEMTDPANSTPEAVIAIESRFPAAALAQLEFEGDWSDVDAGSLVSVRMPGSDRHWLEAHPSVRRSSRRETDGSDTPKVTNK
jgi:phosphohistidine phosphatase